MKKFALIGFVLAGVCELISVSIEATALHFVCKPLIMITLGVYYWSAADQEHRSSTVIVAAFFSLVGDTLLMFQKTDQLFFMLGLAAFLIAHIFYIFSYRQHRTESRADELHGVQKMRLGFPVILAGSGLVVILYPTLGEMRVPVLLYALVLVVMVLNALFRYGRTNMKSYWLVFGGALLFMISDSMIAINEFHSPIKHAGFLIMTTYIIAQFLIVTGLLKHKATT